MILTFKQKAILYGLVLGDGYLQKTGKKNARLRLEQSQKQKAYLLWKIDALTNLFNQKPVEIQRKYPNGQIYNYCRVQSNASPFLGKIRQDFYRNERKILPNNLGKYLKIPLTLAVWYMDDGYYDVNDKSAHIYLAKYQSAELNQLSTFFQRNFGIKPKYYCRPDRESCQLNFTGKNFEKLVQIIKPNIISSMKYKLPLDPVTTESKKIDRFEA